jgi:hypothetical protein
MKKVIECVAGLVCVSLFFAGLILCVSETSSINEQIKAACIGLAMVAASAIIGAVLNRGEQDVFQ